ncbi:hypothetical protein DFH29DRAFT_795151 [Suillus ampliporus]|nr:hypothetical protein DFH29DRAFT_795151 [Suillus ampliporus]
MRKHVQAQPTHRPRVTLSKEARAALTVRRHDNSRRFKSALQDAWNGLDETVKTIASSHHKSFHCVQNDLCIGGGMMRFKCSKSSAWNASRRKKRQENKENGVTGKDVLQEIVKDHREEYQDLTEAEKSQLLLEYGEYKETKTSGVQISTKSKIIDVTQTLKAIKSELNNLKSRTGTEAMLYATRGSTDLPLRGIAFATEGVEEFMPSVMNIDNQDLISKMEGFAVQGMKGAANNHKKRCSNVRAALCKIITQKLVEITKDDSARMHWANYFRNVVQPYQVIVEGWPANIPFINLSEASSALPDLEMLERKWRSGAVYWRRLGDEEFQQLLEERNEKLETSEIVEHCRRTRSDKGKKRALWVQQTE